jgi:hypothetical protein
MNRNYKNIDLEDRKKLLETLQDIVQETLQGRDTSLESKLNVMQMTLNQALAVCLRND